MKPLSNKEESNEKWSEYLNYLDKENNYKFVIDKHRKIRFKHIVKNDTPAQREKFIEFSNGAKTKWHVHTKKQKLKWEKGEGYVEIKIILNDRTWRNFWLKYKIIKVQISEKSPEITIQPFTFHRLIGIAGRQEFICLAKTSGYTIWNKERHYSTNPLPTFEVVNEKNKDILLKFYSEVQSNYRHLADIRFKLLGFVPAISVIAWATLISRIYDSSTESIKDEIEILGLTISLLGLLITIGIKIYDTRNDAIYNDLISRGRKIEHELGIHTGIFKGRIKGGKFINHGMGLNFIYISVISGWGLMIVWLMLNILQVN